MNNASFIGRTVVAINGSIRNVYHSNWCTVQYSNRKLTSWNTFILRASTIHCGGNRMRPKWLFVSIQHNATETGILIMRSMPPKWLTMCCTSCYTSATVCMFEDRKHRYISQNTGFLKFSKTKAMTLQSWTRCCHEFVGSLFKTCSCWWNCFCVLLMPPQRVVHCQLYKKVRSCHKQIEIGLIITAIMDLGKLIFQLFNAVFKKRCSPNQRCIHVGSNMVSHLLLKP
jgi:hypothetical protein